MGTFGEFPLFALFVLPRWFPHGSLFTSMPPVSTGAKVLVTGANGFIAAQTCAALTQRGYHTIGTVGSKSKGEYLKKVLGDKFDYVVVVNIEKVTLNCKVDPPLPISSLLRLSFGFIIP